MIAFILPLDYIRTFLDYIIETVLLQFSSLCLYFASRSKCC